ncbi:quinolinate synthase NadA [Porphyromonadaceae bacterium W3.11]|nr:quinolinate synthase NadA [Porphyromonadaceae bacterium W3.11]
MGNIIDEINRLKKEKNAVVLVHYYQKPEVQQIADYLGDSLGLSQQAAQTDADIILFCGVHFMAETASIISPNKKVLIPVENAGCTLAESVTAAGIRTWKKKHPDGLVVSYVNTTAEVKAETDYCVTSANALEIVKRLPQGHPILFGPDRHLGGYIQKVTGREMDIWQGACYVHEKITADLVRSFLDKYSDADLLIHPESEACLHDDILNHPRVQVGSTAFIMKAPQRSDKKQFIIATELDTLTELKKNYPDKEFIPILPEQTCEYMKLISLEDVRDALLYERYEVKVPTEIRDRAIISIQRMME